jgi:hypothetical protein
MYGLNSDTGSVVLERNLKEKTKPDVLSCDGTSIFLRNKRYDKKGGLLDTKVPHLYSSSGFLNDTWWHRTYWQFGTYMGSNYGGWPGAGSRVPAGRIMVVDKDFIYGFGRLNQYGSHGSHVGLGKMRYLMYASPRSPKAQPAVTAAAKKAQIPGKGAGRKKKKQQNPVSIAWSETSPVLARGMVLSGDLLFMVGPANLFTTSPEGKDRPYDLSSRESLLAQDAALKGANGSILTAVSAKNGNKLAEYKIESLPAWDGLAAANDSLFISTLNGKVLCFK